MTACPPAFSTDQIKLSGPHTDQGAFDRAVLVARHLFETGQWDGRSEIVIADPYDAYRQLERAWTEQGR